MSQPNRTEDSDAVSIRSCHQYRPNWLSETSADDALDRLWSDLDWRQQPIRLFGREVLQPRLTAWCADPDVRYRYSGLELKAEPWHDLLLQWRRRLELELGTPFNSVLANAYRGGEDSMGWHSDDEPELGIDPVIASISLGAIRRFLVGPRPRGPSTGFDLEHGSLMVMSGVSQSRFRHAVPRTRRPTSLRINLTYRRVLDRSVASC